MLILAYEVRLSLHTSFQRYAPRFGGTCLLHNSRYTFPFGLRSVLPLHVREGFTEFTEFYDDIELVFIVGTDDVGTSTGDLREDALAHHAGGMVGFRRPHVEGELGASLVAPRHQALEQRYLIDEPQAERGEVVSPVLGGRQHHELEVRVHPQFPDGEGCGYP